MIRINLATRKAPVGGGGGDSAKGGVSLEKQPGQGAGRKFDIKQFDAEAAVEVIRGLPLRKIFIPVIACALVYMGNNWQQQDELGKVDKEIAGVLAQQGKLKTEIAKTKGYEDIKKQLEVDELLLRTKIATIEKLLADRQTPPKLLLSLSASIPSNVWLSSYSIKEGNVQIGGTSLDYNQISDFMKGLNEVPLFKDVALESSQQSKDDKDITTQVFQLKAKRK